MSCKPLNIRLPDTFRGDTWDGLTWALESVDEGDTEFDGVLTLARFQLQSPAGVAALTLSSATAGQVTINESAANEWDVTVEPRILAVDAGTYTWALELTDDTGVIKTVVAGTIRINPDPVI